MQRNLHNPHFIMRITALMLCILGIVLLLFSYVYTQKNINTEITDLHAKSNDGEITVSWIPPSSMACDHIHVIVSHNDEPIMEEDFAPTSKGFSFLSGEHGELYHFSARVINRDGSEGNSLWKIALFLEYDKLPDLPLFAIDTLSGEDPSFTYVEAPEGNWGATQRDNVYLPGTINITGLSQTIDDQVKIRTRGNTSCVWNPKRAYKIQLKNPEDLLHDGTGKAYKEWVLLNNGNNLHTFIGVYIAQLCGMEWQPQMRFVNLILNGDWKGCYCLMEALSFETISEHISESGYLFENDNYWWNADDVYFKTEHQIPQIGYTFKYPEILNPEDTRIAPLQAHMQQIEDMIFAGDSTYEQYLDVDTVVKWMLARDIAGTTDGAGTNMYFYKYDFLPTNPSSSLVKMGPMWDFDRIMETPDRWSDCRTEILSFLPVLLEDSSFQEAYKAQWDSMNDSFYFDIESKLNELEQIHGAALDESWRLEFSRHEDTYIPPFEEQKQEMLNWFFNRTLWIDQELNIQ